MPRIARKSLENGFFHIMVQGIKKEEIFYKNQYKQKYIQLMKFFKEKQKIIFSIKNNTKENILI